MNSVSLPAYAKVNLFLGILGKRSDGYHELWTLFERVGLADEVTVRRLPGTQVQFRCESPEVPQDGSNLAVRAAQAYREASGWSDGVEITLVKRIPAGAGMGGGSSNAAAVLLALQRLTGAAAATDSLVNCARSLGSDVPFFLADCSFGLGRGRGDEIEPLLFHAKLWHLLVTPDFPIPTQAVYQNFRLPRVEAAPGASALRLTAPRRDPGALLDALRNGKVSSARNLLYNALEPTVEQLYPAIRRVKSELESAGLEKPTVSGSGSTVFALCDSEAQARSAGEVLRKKHPAWRIFTAETI